jgi:hippurate hydrolase
MAMLLCASKYLSERRNFSGRCYVIFQPAEEGGAGARRMMEDGLFRRFPMESVWGLHNWPGKPVGWVGVKDGAMMASTDVFEIRVKGKGGHAAMPHQVRDPVVAASHLVVGLQSIVSRGTDPLDSVVVSVTKFRGGEVFNVIPDEVSLGGTVRTLSKESFARVEEEIERVNRGVSGAFGVEVLMDYRRNYPVLENTVSETALAEDVARDLLGRGNVERTLPTMGGEDFAFMLEEKPGSYVFLGNGEGSENLHSARYDFNDEALEFGASYWVCLVERLLSFDERG